MSYSTTTSEQQFPGNGVLTSFSYNHNVPSAAGAQVKISLFDNDTGSETVLVSGVHYTLSGVGGSGGITITYPIVSSPAPFDNPVTSDQTLVAEIVPDHDQNVDIKHSDTFSPKVVEDEFDREVRIDQAQQSEIDRSFKVARGQPNPEDGVVPGITGAKVLLVDSGVVTGTSIDMVSINWPLFYDRIELEIVRARPNVNGEFSFNPIDNGTVTTADLVSNGIERIGGAQANFNNTTWITPEVGNASNEQLVGRFVISHFEATLAGFGDTSHGHFGFGGAIMFFRRTSAGTRWDGIQFTQAAGTFTAQLRLWGLPRA